LSELAKPEKIAEIDSIRGHELDPEEAHARLGELLSDEDAEVRAEAAAAVWEHADNAELVEQALELSTKDDSPRVRAKCLTALGRVLYEGSLAGADEPSYQPDAFLGEPSAETFKKVRAHLQGVASDEKRTLDERRFALEGLGFLGDDAAIAKLIESFWKRPEPAARLSAVFAMGRSGHPRFGAAIQEALASSEPELKLQAIWAAGEAEIQGARAPLAGIAERSRDREERFAAIEALARLGGETTAQVLLAIAEGDKDPEIREAAATGLEELALLDAMEEEEEEDSDEDE
jgi:HEAT repeat protein